MIINREPGLFPGGFPERRFIMGIVDEVKDKVDNLLDKTDIDEKIVGAAGSAKEKAKELLDKTDIDEKIAGKIDDLKEKVTGK